MRRAAPLLFCVATAAALSGCAKPNASNIALRKEVQTLQGEVETLKRQHAADAAALPPTSGPAASQPVYGTGADRLFTTHGIRLGRLTRVDDEGMKVHVVPTDDSGDDLKAAGAITVVAFDLIAGGHQVGRWQYSVAAARPLWNGQGLRYEYVVPCPWVERPSSKEITVRVTFEDALTGRKFDAQQVVPVRAE